MCVFSCISSITVFANRFEASCGSDWRPQGDLVKRQYSGDNHTDLGTCRYIVGTSSTSSLACIDLLSDPLDPMINRTSPSWLKCYTSFTLQSIYMENHVHSTLAKRHAERPNTLKEHTLRKTYMYAVHVQPQWLRKGLMYTAAMA